MTDENPPNPKVPRLDDQHRIHVFLAEYQALYGLLHFRLEAMDQRLPLVGGVFLAVLGGLASMPSEAKQVLLLALPAGVIWLGSMTISHVRSKEDIKRRIDEIESCVNAIADEKLLAFQSRHPDQSRHVGGRTGMAAVHAVITLCVTLLASCAYLFNRAAFQSTLVSVGYYAFVSSAAFYLVYQTFGLGRYRYSERTSRLEAN